MNNTTPSNDNDTTPTPSTPSVDDLKRASAIIDEQLSNGEMVEVDPDVAEFMGAFEETAVTEEEALEAHLFPYGEDGEEKPGVLKDIPYNPVSGTFYQGGNHLWLEMQARPDPRFHLPFVWMHSL